MPRIALWILLCVLTCLPASAATYYVASGGSDAAAGSTGAPWATLQHAADTVAAGDTVVVRAGSYKGFDLRTSGASGRPITFSADAGVLINGNNSRTPDGINVENASYVVIEGFRVTNRTRAGIRIAVGDHNTVRRCVTDQNATWGIFTSFNDDLLIEDNECSRSGTQHGIYTSNSGDRPVVRRNRLWGNAGCGLHMNGDESMGGDGIISGALVDSNIIWENGASGGSGINCDGVQDSVFRNNLLYNNHASGLSLYQIDGAGPGRNDVVVNNTIIQATDGRWALNIKNGSSNIIAYNNILLHRGTRGAIEVDTASLVSLKSDFNAVTDVLTPDDGETFLNLTAWQSATEQDLHSFVATPTQLFLDAAKDDYLLSANSPAIDKGTLLQAPGSDLRGNLRNDGKIDLGCYEYCVNCSHATLPAAPSGLSVK